MKLLNRILIWSISVILLIFIGTTLYLKFYAKDQIVLSLRSALKQNVTIDTLNYHLPLAVTAYDVAIGDNINAAYVKVDFSLEAILKRQLIISQITCIKPVIKMRPQENRSEESSLPVESKSESTSKPQASNSVSSSGIVIKKFVVVDGKFEYISGGDSKGLSFKLDQINGLAQHFQYPLKSIQTYFKMNGKLVQGNAPLSGGNVELLGWTDIAKKDLDAKLKIFEVQGSGNLNADLVAKNNRLKVDGKIAMNHLTSLTKGLASDNGSVQQLVMNSLSSMGVEIGASFSFETALDNIQIQNISFSGNVITKDGNP